MNLYIVSVDLINGLYPIVLDVLSLIAIFSGVLVITTKNPIVSVLFLISLFLVIAVYLIMVGMHFIGLAYLLVYIGAIAILFLFTIMLMNIRVSELLSYTNNSIPLAIIFSIIMYNSLYWISTPVAGTLNLAIDMSSSYKWDGVLVSSSHIASVGNIMYSSHSIWLIIVGFILLLAMVGTIIITLSQPFATKGLLKQTFINKLSNNEKTGGTSIKFNLIQRRNYSAINSDIQPELNPYFVSGFVDAEGTFVVLIAKT
jgi:NADH-ubiquinone oxidoreductase chain 6